MQFSPIVLLSGLKFHFNTVVNSGIELVKGGLFQVTEFLDEIKIRKDLYTINRHLPEQEFDEILDSESEGFEPGYDDTSSVETFDLDEPEQHLIEDEEQLLPLPPVHIYYPRAQEQQPPQPPRLQFYPKVAQQQTVANPIPEPLIQYTAGLSKYQKPIRINTDGFGERELNIKKQRKICM